MCGVVGIVSHKNIAEKLINGLKRLEYRGYDSSGIAVVDSTAPGLHRLRKAGKLQVLIESFHQQPISGTTGIAHTRWATHGIPNETNAHPHMTDQVAMVHNGIIENYQTLKEDLLKKGYHFDSQTDTEVALKVLDDLLDQGLQPLQAVQRLGQLIQGSYALIMIFRDHPNLMIGIRNGPPLIVGSNHHENYLGSDSVALNGYVQKIAYLNDGDIAVLTPGSTAIYDRHGNPVNYQFSNYQDIDAVSKGSYDHYMLKEIHQQPDVMRKTLLSIISESRDTICFPTFDYDFTKCQKVILVACGSSYYAALVTKYWIEQLAQLSCEVDVASEFRYRSPPLTAEGLYIFISQSGETADTIAAHHYVRSQNHKTLSIVNVANSTLSRESTYTIVTQAGPEIGVASTKAFTTQLTVLACLALSASHQRGQMDQVGLEKNIQDLINLPVVIEKILRDTNVYQQLGQSLKDCRDVLYLGRGSSYAVAMEGALKLKEISYIHAEGYPAGEMKHGPIALIDHTVPIIVIAPIDHLIDKTLSNVQEAAARRGKIILLTDSPQPHSDFDQTISLPSSTPLTSPLLYTIPVQLIAYYTALAKGTDVDQPRNLAKSVTVE